MESWDPYRSYGKRRCVGKGKGKNETERVMFDLDGGHTLALIETKK